MKIIIITVPLRGEPALSPPLGPLSIIKYLRKNIGEEIDVELLDIDGHRFSFDDAIKILQKKAPDILGISAVVSTSYAYTKKVSQKVRQILPQTKIVVGGNLCASAEILLRKTEVDVCVLGEGEKVFLNLVKHYKNKRNSTDLIKIPGLMYLNEQDHLVNTGYESPLSSEEIWDIDFSDLEKRGSIDMYFPKVPLQENKGKLIRKDDHRFDSFGDTTLRVAGLTCAKGCIARCTFCHRWNKGIRQIPLDIVFKRLDFLIEQYDVRIVSVLAEAFGANRRWLEGFIDRIKPYNILWRAGGMRTSSVTPELIERMKNSGCYSIVYGNETGSSNMLKVMQKKVSLEDNFNAAKWTIEAGLGTTVQLVVGMPGESPETIHETINYCKYINSASPFQDPRQISINYAQALPGTPLYEFARKQGLIGTDINSEEEYLISISNKNAADPMTCINFTNYSRLTLLSWKLLIRIHVYHYYLKKYGASHYYKVLLDDKSSSSGLSDSARESILKMGRPTFILFIKLLIKGQTNMLMSCFPTFFFRTRFLTQFYTLLKLCKTGGLHTFRILVGDWFSNIFHRRKKPWTFDYKSLREIVNNELTSIPEDTPEMLPLRKGR